MANSTNFSTYGGKEDFLPCAEGKIAAFVEKSGGPVDPYGDTEKKEKGSIDMNAAEAFHEKSYTKVDAMGTEAAKKGGKPGQFSSNSGDHFKVGDVDPSGNEAGKGKSGQNSKRA